MMGNGRTNVALRRMDRDFHSERIRRRNYWRNALMAFFLLAGAAMLVAAISLLSR